MRSLSAVPSFRSQGGVRYFVVTVHLPLRKAFGVLQVRKPFPETVCVQTHSSNTFYTPTDSVYPFALLQVLRVSKEACAIDVQIVGGPFYS